MKQSADILFSIIVPVYNRPDEIADLLGSLAAQTDRGFEIVIVEDGSTVPCLGSDRRGGDRMDPEERPRSETPLFPERKRRTQHSA